MSRERCCTWTQASTTENGDTVFFNKLVVRIYQRAGSCEPRSCCHAKRPRACLMRIQPGFIRQRLIIYACPLCYDVRAGGCMTRLETVVVLLVVVPLIPIAWARVELLQWGLQPGDKSLILNQPFPPAAAYRVPDLALGFMVGFVITWF